MSWTVLAEDKKRRQAASIPEDWLIKIPPETQLDVTSIPAKCGLLSAKELEITDTTDVEVLLKKLASGEWSSVEVTTAFYKRAIVAHQLVNCLTEIFVQRALARASELDAYLKTNGRVVGSLHGLPISLKDQHRIKGLETTMGYVSWIGDFAKQNSALVDILYEAGAVPFVQTNVPQTLMWAETFNNIFGRTLNPHNRSLTSGGSSGGEGALIALRGSPLGVGSDIGGSVRIPSAFNGLYGLRPSYGRVPYAGAVNSMEGQESILSVFGPIANSLNGVKLFMKAVIAGKPWLKDPIALRKKWDEDAYALEDHGGGRGLCFGLMWNDGQVVPHPPILRALEMARDALRRAGHTVVDWTPYKHQEICSTMYLIWNAGSEEDYKTVTAPTGEPIISTMAINQIAGAKNPLFQSHPEEIGINAYQLWQLHKRKLQLRQEYLEYWENTKRSTGTGRPVDAIIAPCAPYAAPPHGTNWNVNYTMVWNGLDYVSCVLPVTKVLPSVDFARRDKAEFLSAADQRHFESYDPIKFTNAPISLQVVGRTQEEEALIAMAEIVDGALKAYKDPYGSKL